MSDKILYTGNIGAIKDRIAGKILVDAIALKPNNPNADAIDLLGRYKEIIIYESLFSSALEGQITIVDTEGFFEKYLISGGEKITIILSNSEGTPIITRGDFIVHRISESPIDDITLVNVYTLYFTTESYLKSLKKRLFKSYFQVEKILYDTTTKKRNTEIQKLKMNEIVEDIYKRVSMSDLHRIKIFQEIKTELNRAFISPGLTPFKALEYLAKRFSHSEFFVFYERLIPTTSEIIENNQRKTVVHSHFFGSIDKIVNACKNTYKNDIYTIVYSPTIFGNIEKGSTNNVLRTNKVVKLSGFNHIDAMMTGFYNLRITSIDAATKSYLSFFTLYGKRVESATDDFYAEPLIAKGSIFDLYKPVEATNDFINEYEQPEAPGEKLIYSATQYAGFGSEITSKSEWLPTNIIGQISKNIFKLRLTIEGGSNAIGVGNIINFRMPSQQKKTLDPQNSAIEDDKIYSGSYIVTEVKHMIVGNDYLKEIDIARGSSSVNLLTGQTAQGVIVSPSQGQSQSSQFTRDYIINNIKAEVPLIDNINKAKEAVYSKVINGQIYNLRRQTTGSLAGFPDDATEKIILGLGITIDASGNYSGNSYSVLANLIKLLFPDITYGEVFVLFYPGSINTISANFGEIRSVNSTSGTYLKQTEIDKIKAKIT